MREDNNPPVNSVQNEVSIGWLTEELFLCGSFLGCREVEEINEMKTQTKVHFEDDVVAVIRQRAEYDENNSVNTSDKTIVRRGAAPNIQPLTDDKHISRDSNTVVAVAPLLKREGSYEFDQQDCYSFVTGKTFVFVHEDFQVSFSRETVAS